MGEQVVRPKEDSDELFENHTEITDVLVSQVTGRTYYRVRGSSKIFHYNELSKIPS